MPRFSGWEAGTPPMPSSVTAIGICARSASARISPLGARLHHAVAGENQRPLGGVDQRERLADDRRRPAAHRRTPPPDAARPRPNRARQLPCCASLVMSTSTGPGRPDLRDRKRLANGRRDVGGAGDQIVVLGDRQRDAGDVGLLERVGADQLAADLTGDADDRRRVHHRRRDAGDHVGGAGARGRDRHADACRSRARSRRPCASRPARGGRGCGGSGYSSIAS